MSGRLELLASPHDRLDPVAAAVRWWTSRLAEALGAGRRAVIPASVLETDEPGKAPRSVAIALPTEDVFTCRVTLPPGDPSAHRKALALRIQDLAPIDPAQLEIAARRAEDKTQGGRAAGSEAVYVLAMARAERLAALEAAARRRGARSVCFHLEGDGDLTLDTALARLARLRSTITDMALALALAAAGIVAVTTITAALERETAALLAADQELRRTAVAEERAAREAELAQGLVARGLLERRPGVVIEDLAAINAATPDAAWWARVRWTPGEATITGMSAEAAAAIEALGAAAEGWSVEPAGPVRAGPDGGAQTFELRLRKREAADER